MRARVSGGRLGGGAAADRGDVPGAGVVEGRGALVAGDFGVCDAAGREVEKVAVVRGLIEESVLSGKRASAGLSDCHGAARVRALTNHHLSKVWLMSGSWGRLG